jgi:signal transduction histidine kinase/ligand-binding sensor domain-containing protein
MLCRPTDFSMYGFPHSGGHGCGSRLDADLLRRSKVKTHFGLVGVILMTGLGFCDGADKWRAGGERGLFVSQQWTSDHGLPQNKISCLKRTRDGYLWIGTYFGLARFDGMQFTLFKSDNVRAMKSEVITALAEDSQGTLWIGTDSGLVSYRENKFRAEAAPAETIAEIVPARSGGVWLQTQCGFAKLLPNCAVQCWNGEAWAKDPVRSLAEGSDGSLNVFTRTRWLVLSATGDQWTTNWTAPSADMNCLTACLSDESGCAWLGTFSGVYFCSNHVCRPELRQFGTNAVHRIFCEHTGALWVALRSGEMGRWHRGQWQTFGAEPGGDNPLCVEEDYEGSVWLGTARGLFQVREPLVTTFDTSDGLSHNKIWSICEAMDGTIWMGTERGLSSITPKGKIQAVAGNNTERCVWPHPGNGVWTSRTGRGLYEVHDGETRCVAAASVFPGSITSFWQEDDGPLHVGSEGGFLTFDNSAPKPWLRPSMSFPIGDVRSILRARDGTLWLGTETNGIARLRSGKPEFSTTRQGLSGNSVWSIIEDADGFIWVATDNGLTRWKEGQFSAITTRQGLLERTVNCVLDDQAGSLWLSGHQGIYRASRKQLNAVADGKELSVEPYLIGTPDGMASGETNGGKQPSAWRARDGRLWFPTIHGAIAVDPKRVPPQPTPPAVLIEQIKSDGEVIFGDGSPDESVSGRVAGPPVRIGPGQGRLEFRYTATSLVASERARFRYRLSGVDSDWREPTAERVAHYTLHPGHYKFELTGADCHNVWNPLPAVFPFYLAPHFYETWAFYLACALLVIGVAASIVAYHLQWQRKLLKLEEQRSLANERTRIARDLHDDLGTALTGLALQLEVASRDAKASVPLAERLSGTARQTRDLAERMREVVWTVNPGCDNVASLADFLEQQISQFLRADTFQVRLDFPEQIPDLPLGGAVRHHLALSVREALTNVVRHARASQVMLRIALESRHLLIELRDNGCGLRPTDRQGNGLKNMRARLEQINGSFSCESEPGSGTTITFRVPLPDSASTQPRKL